MANNTVFLFTRMMILFGILYVYQIPLAKIYMREQGNQTLTLRNFNSFHFLIQIESSIKRKSAPCIVPASLNICCQYFDIGYVLHLALSYHTFPCKTMNRIVRTISTKSNSTSYYPNLTRLKKIIRGRLTILHIPCARGKTKTGN